MSGRLSSRPRVPPRNHHKAPTGRPGRGIGAWSVAVRWGCVLSRWWGSQHDSQAGGQRSARRVCLDARNGCDIGCGGRAVCPAWPCPSTPDALVCFHARPPASARGSIPVQQAQRAISTGVDAPDIERRSDRRQISLGLLTNRTHPRPRQWLWLAGDGYASCPLVATADGNFLPRLRCACLLAGQESPRPPSSTPFRPFRCNGSKPLPETSHRGRE